MQVRLSHYLPLISHFVFRTVREEMNDESDEFLELFSEEIVYFDGAKTHSGFYVVEKATFVKKLGNIFD